MKLNITKLAIGALALLTASAVVATAANASVVTLSNHGEYVVMGDTTSKTCAMRISNSTSELIIAHSGTNHQTTILYSDPALGDLSGLAIPFTLILDEKEYDWKGTGGKGMVSVVSSDTKVPTVLRDAKAIGAKILDTDIFAVASGPNFDSAMTSMLACAHRK